jgi:hypothetical protein
MATKNEKHRIGELVEDYGDYFAVGVGMLGFLYVVGALADLTLFPSYDGGLGLFSMAGQFAAVGGTTVSWGLALAALAPVFAGATNIIQDMIAGDGEPVGEQLKTYEGVAAVGAPLLPVLVAHITEINSLATGGIGMQLAFITAYGGLIATLARE